MSYNITQKWKASAPYLLSILRMVAAFMFILAGTMKLFAFLVMGLVLCCIVLFFFTFQLLVQAAGALTQNVEKGIQNLLIRRGMTF